MHVHREYSFTNSKNKKERSMVPNAVQRGGPPPIRTQSKHITEPSSSSDPEKVGGVRVESLHQRAAIPSGAAVVSSSSPSYTVTPCERGIRPHLHSSIRSIVLTRRIARRIVLRRARFLRIVHRQSWWVVRCRLEWGDDGAFQGRHGRGAIVVGRRRQFLYFSGAVLAHETHY